MTRNWTGGALAAALAVCAAACGEAPERPRAAPAAAAAPPSPDLPMTRAKAREIVAGLSLDCTTLANLKYDMNRCAQHLGQGPDDAGFREEMRSLRAELDALSSGAAGARCAEIQQELGRQPIPRPCWEMAATPED